jgi:myxalamid-type polyketide synthase MxaE and MxaD
MSEVLAQWQADARPPIRGCIHTAAVIDDQLLTELSPHSIGKVFGAKATGAWLLHSVVADADWLVLFSSMASIWPAPGHANYAAANAFLDALAQYRRGNGRHALSIDWGLWSEVGFAATPGGRESARLAGELGINGFSPADGLRALDELLARPATHAAVLNADRAMLGAQVLPLLRGFAASAGDTDAARSNVSVTFTEQLRHADAAASIALLRQRIAGHVEAVLKLENVRLDIHKPLGEYGLNSIVGLELRHRLERDLALRLPATLVFNYPSVAALATHLRGRLDPAAAAPQKTGPSAAEPRRRAPETPDRARSADARVAQLEALSDDAALAALRSAKSGVNP